MAPPLSHNVIFAASNLKLQDICYGSVILQGMYRLCSRIRVQKCQNEVYDFFTLSKLMIAKLPQIDVERWSVTTWIIWNAQNKFYFEKSQAHPLKHIGWGLWFSEWVLAAWGCVATRLTCVSFCFFTLSFTATILFWAHAQELPYTTSFLINIISICYLKKKICVVTIYHVKLLNNPKVFFFDVKITQKFNWLKNI